MRRIVGSSDPSIFPHCNDPMTDDRPIPSRVPMVQKMEPGDYYWCSCGRSSGQPFCDGSHAGTEHLPVKVTIEEERKVAWCTCKRSANGAFCDGAHAKLPPA